MTRHTPARPHVDLNTKCGDLPCEEGKGLVPQYQQCGHLPPYRNLPSVRRETLDDGIVLLSTLINVTNVVGSNNTRRVLLHRTTELLME